MWGKIKNAAKKVGKAIKKAVETVVDVVTTVVGVIVETLESIISWLGSAIGFIVGIVRLIPIVRWALEIIKEIIWRIGIYGSSLLDFGLSLIGITPEKKLRICVVVLRQASDPAGPLNASVESDIIQNLNDMIAAYKTEANVRVVPSRPFQYSTAFNDLPVADAKWIHFRDEVSASDVLNVRCVGGAVKDDLGKAGSKFELIANTSCFYSTFRRLIGYGAPVIVFVVLDVAGKLGCSLGPLTDYVTASRPGLKRDPLLIAHEAAHACGLWHMDDPVNIAHPNSGRGTDMRRWQVAIVRNSRHVTYL